MSLTPIRPTVQPGIGETQVRHCLVLRLPCLTDEQAAVMAPMLERIIDKCGVGILNDNQTEVTYSPGGIATGATSIGRKKLR